MMRIPLSGFSRLKSSGYCRLRLFKPATRLFRPRRRLVAWREDRNFGATGPRPAPWAPVDRHLSEHRGRVAGPASS